MSRISSAIPIYALTRHESTRRRVTLYRGVYPLRFDVVQCQSLLGLSRPPLMLCSTGIWSRTAIW